MRKVLTRWIACILSLVMMIETCPAAWAEETEILPPGAIEAARALAGTDEDADYFYEGMAPEISWNARMLADWIESILSHEMYAVQNSWSDLEKTLCTMEEEAPDLYGQMTSGENAAFAEKAGEMFILSEDLRETIRYYQDILDEGGEKIESQIASILSADSSEAEKERSAWELDATVDGMREARKYVVENAGAWTGDLESWSRCFDVGGAGETEGTDPFAAWVAEVLNWNVTAIDKNVTASLYPDRGQSLLARLSPVSSALAADTSDEMEIMVLDDRHFAVTLEDEKGKGVPDVWVTVTDNDRGQKSGYAKSNANGFAVFPVSGFTVDREGKMNLTVIAGGAGYRYTMARGQEVPKGGKYSLILRKDDGKPYFVSATFNDGEMLNSERQILYSPYNDLKHEISALAVNGGSSVSVSYASAQKEGTGKVKASAKDAEVRFWNGKQYESLKVKKYTWEEKWKQMLKPGEKVRLVSDGSPDQVLMLKVVRGVSDRPLTDGKTGAMGKVLNNLSGFGSGLMSYTLPASIGKPIGGSTLSLDLPFTQHLPIISLDMDGSLTVAYGIDLGLIAKTKTKEGEASNWRADHTWRTEDQKDIDKKVKEAQKKGAWAAYKASVGSAFEGMEKKSVQFLGTAMLDFGGFLMIQGRLKASKLKDAAGGDYMSSTDLSFTVGAVLTFTAEYTIQTQFAVYVSFGFSLSAAVGFTIGGELSNFSFRDASRMKLNFSRGLTGISIMLKLQLSVTAGLGIKGVASISITGYGYLSLSIRWTLQSLTPAVTLSFGAGLYLAVQIVLFKHQISLLEMKPEKILWENDVARARKSGFSFLDLLMASAQAEEKGKEADVSSLRADSFPDLAPAMEETAARELSIRGGKMKVLSVFDPQAGKDNRYAFYIAPVKCGNGTHDRVCWRNLDKGTTGVIHPSGNELYDGDTYAFDISVAYTQAVLGILCTKGYRTETVTDDQGNRTDISIPASTEAQLLPLYMGARAYPEEVQYNTSVSGSYQYASVSMGEEVYEEPNVHIYPTRFYKAASGANVFVRGEASMVVSQRIPLSEDKVDSRKMWTVTMEVANGGAVHYSKSCVTVKGGFTHDMLSFVRYRNVLIGRRYQDLFHLKKKEGSSDKTVIANMSDAMVQLPELASGNIPFYDVVSWMNYTKNVTNIFYLERETGKEETRTSLKGINIVREQPATGRDELAKGRMTVRSIDYDVNAETPSFRVLCTPDRRTLLYWLASARKSSEKDPDKYDLVCVQISSDGLAATEPYVLAEFEVPVPGAVPLQAVLNDETSGTLVLNLDGTASKGSATDPVRVSCYTFSLKLKPGLDIRKMVLETDVANPGGYLDAMVSVANPGNLAVGWFDLQLLHTDDRGQESVAETIHCDLLKPERSNLTVGGKVATQGRKTAYAAPPAMNPMVQSAHRIKVRETLYMNGTEQKSEEVRQVSSAAELLPGAAQVYRVNLKIPADWTGKKAVRLRVSGIGAIQNGKAEEAARNAANTAAGQPNGPETGGIVREEETQFVVFTPETSASYSSEPVIPPFDPYDDAEVLAYRLADGGTLALSGEHPEIYGDTVPEEVYDYAEDTLIDLDADATVYTDGSGERILAITLQNFSDIEYPLTLYAEMFTDDDMKPVYVALPFYKQYTAGETAQTVELKLSTLLAGRRPWQLLLRIYARENDSDDVSEIALRNNEFMLYFDNDEREDPLRFVRQPADVSVMEKENGKFSVAVKGGVPPYTYRWQAWMGESMGWKNIPDSDSPELVVKNATMGMNGWKYRCVVKDHNLNEIVSEPARLLVRKPVPTGDGAPPVWILLGSGAMLLFAWFALRRKSRTK